MFRPTSKEQVERMVSKGAKEERIYSFFPCDHWKCECQGVLLDYKTRFSQMKPNKIDELKEREKVVRCPKGKTMKRYTIICNECKAPVAECAADNKVLDNWCDLHYISTSYTIDGVSGVWKGALSVNISPIDGKLGFECSCGVDTRDFRANSTMKGKELKRKIEECSAGRLFGDKDSKFKAVEMA